MENLSQLKYQAEVISQNVRKEVGDKGSCVLGYKLKVDGVQFIQQPAQGSSTCEAVYSKVKAMLIENGISDSRIVIDYGRMD